MKRILSIFLSSYEKSHHEYVHEKLQQLAVWGYKFTPLVAVDRPPPELKHDARFYGINLDITASRKLFKDERQILRAVRKELRRMELQFRLATAPTLGAAWALTRYGTDTIAVSGTGAHNSLRKSLAALPIASLRLEPKTEIYLLELHIRHIQDLYCIPRSSLLSRFGTALVRQLDLALGLQEELIEPVKYSPTLKRERIFAGPTTQLEAVEYTCKELLEQLTTALEQSHRKLSVLLVQIKVVQAPTIVKRLTFSVPSTNFKHIWSLLRTQLETIQMGFGVEGIRLTVQRSERAQAVYNGSIDPDSSEDFSNRRETGELLDSLEHQLGKENVLQLKNHESHIPERAFNFISALPLPKNGSSFLSPQRREARVLQSERPSIIFYRPQPITALSLLPDSPPSRLQWRKKLYAIHAGLGPERIAPEWWGADEALCKTRDYFKVQLTCGTWLWIYREVESAEWYMHGIWA